jgi:uncharacterized membrane protein
MDLRAPQEMPSSGMVTLTHVLYAMHGFSALMGLLGPMFIVTAFLTGWPSIIAVIINYVKRSDVRGTYLESHFSWQIRTFWYAVLWVILALILVITILGIPLAWILAMIVGIWVLYRIIRGWMTLLEGRPMPVVEATERV